MIVVTVQMALDCAPSEASDAVNEMLREQQRAHNPQSCLVDYAICPFGILERPTDADSDDYAEGEAFISL